MTESETDARGATTRPTSPALRRVFAAPRAVMVALVRVYQRTVGLMIPNSCRFSPTCSEYAAEAIRKHGALKGLWLSMRRIVRCNPYCKGGIDPVP